MEEVIHKFYTAFNRLDYETMHSCYHEDIKFEDPVFGVLIGERAKNMWEMLCKSQKGKEFSVTHYNVLISGNTGSATWEAQYFYGKANRKVNNFIKAHFEFKDGLIVKHTDEFNLRKWAAQALGTKGKILGGTIYFKRKLRARSLGLLRNFEAKKLPKLAS
ncbi:MAG: nuclear transport factor 2 family protein [Winogradskyella sp.]|nr:nuclear transport factor 2 family protein [Winogradskyella sp.]